MKKKLSRTIFKIAKVSSEIIITTIEDKLIFVRELRIRKVIQGFIIWGTLMFGVYLRAMNL